MRFNRSYISEATVMRSKCKTNHRSQHWIRVNFSGVNGVQILAKDVTGRVPHRPRNYRKSVLWNNGGRPAPIMGPEFYQNKVSIAAFICFRPSKVVAQTVCQHLLAQKISSITGREKLTVKSKESNAYHKTDKKI